MKGMIRARILTGLSLLLLAVCTAGSARGLQAETTPPAQRPAALAESLHRAFQLIGEGKFQEAKAELERSQTLAAGPCGECLLGMSHVYAAEKDWRRTKEAVRQALPLLKTPGLKARAYVQLGIADFQSRDLDEAEEAFRQAVSSGGAWGMLARYDLAQLLLTRKHWDEAVELARAYLKDAGPDGTALDEARIVLCQARSHQPDDPHPQVRPQAPGLDVKKIEGQVKRPEIIFQTPPAYTQEARMANMRGTVVVEAIIDEEGCIRSTRSLQGLGNGLTESALRAVRTWVFRPAMLEDKPVKVYYVLTVNFQIQANPPPGPPVLVPGPP
jgi:TonB family protein